MRTIDLYQSFEVSSRANKEITSDFCVFRPPHYTYLFTQDEQTKCFKERNHLHHYDAVYVAEITGVHDAFECTHERIKIALPNKPLTVPFIRQKILDVLNSFNFKKQDIRAPEELINDNIVWILYQAHRDYATYLHTIKKV